MRGVCVAWAALMVGATAAQEPIRFRDVTKEAGLFEPLQGIMGHGGAWGDFDGDGKLDLFVGGFCDRPAKEYAPAAGAVASKLFRNLGGGKFAPSGQAEFFARTSGALFADLDGDGRLELYVANNAKRNSKAKDELARRVQNTGAMLFHNVGGKLVDVSAASGACPEAMRTARNIGVFDYDGDGKMDLFVVEDKFIAKPRSALYRNLGGMKFEDVTAKAGLPEDLFGLGLAVADLNGDGWADLFVPHSNRLFLAAPGGKFREATAENPALAWKPLSGEDWPCGATFVDLNRDGRLDLVLTIHGSKARNKIFLHDGVVDGVPKFRDVTEAAGFGDVVPVRCPHVEAHDFDNDGWPDLFVSAAWQDADGAITPLVFRHEGIKDGVPRFRPNRPIAAPMVYYPAAPCADYDGDGRTDLFLINWFQGNHCRLMRNETPGGGWLTVRAKGIGENTQGLGTRVTVYEAGRAGEPAALVGHQEVTIGYGYASGQPAECRFGLGARKTVDVVVRGRGAETVHRNVPVNQVLAVDAK